MTANERNIVLTLSTGDRLHLDATFSDNGMTFDATIRALEMMREMTPDEIARLAIEAEKIGLPVVFNNPVRDSTA